VRPKVGHHIALPQNCEAEIDEAVSEYWRRRREGARVERIPAALLEAQSDRSDETLHSAGSVDQ